MATADEFNRLQEELIKLKEQHYEGVQREKKLKDEVEHLKKAAAAGGAGAGAAPAAAAAKSSGFGGFGNLIDKAKKSAAAFDNSMSIGSAATTTGAGAGVHAAAGAGGAKQTVKDANGVDVDIKTVLQENVNMKREFQDKEVQIQAMRENMQHMGTIQDELEEKLKKANAEHNQQLQVKEEQVQFLKAALDSSKQATAAAGDSLDAAQLENLHQLIDAAFSSEAVSAENSAAFAGVATKVHDAVKTSISAKASSGAAAAAAASAVADPALLAENQLMKKQLEAAKQQIKAAEEAHEKLKSTSESKFFELKRNFEEDLLMKNDELQKLKKQTAAATSATAVKAAGDSEEARKAADAKVVALEKELGQAREAVEVRTNQIKQAKENLKAINTQLEQAMARVTTLEQLAESRKQSVDQLSREKDEMTNKHLKEMAEVQRLNEQLKQESEQLRGTLNNKAESFKGEKDQLNAAIVSAQSQLKETQAKLDEATATRDDLQSKLDKRKERHAKELEEAQTAVAAAQSQLKEIQTKNESVEKEFEALKLQLDDSHSERKIAERKQLQMIKDLKKEVERLSRGTLSRQGSSVALADSSSNEYLSSGTSTPNLAPRSHVPSGSSTHHGHSSNNNSNDHLLDEKVRSLESDVKLLQQDNEAKAKIIQDFLMRERTGILPAASSSSSNHSEPSALEKLGPDMIMSPLSNMIKRAKNANQNTEVQETNRKLQNQVEEYHMKNMELQRVIDSMGVEVDRLRKELKKRTN